MVLYNGSDDASYDAFDLDGFSTDADGFFVICGDAAKCRTATSTSRRTRT